MDDRFGYFLIGCIVGLIVGYIVGSLREIKSEVKKTQGDQKGFSRFPFVTDAALLLSLMIVVWAAITSNQVSNDLKAKIASDKVSLCKAGVEGRQVDRETVDAVFSLATTALIPRDGEQKRTDEQIVRINAYIDRVNQFRDDLYAKIKPSKVCEPFVTDENVKPPTPPFPHVTN